MNLVIVSGRMTRDPEIKKGIKNGRIFCSMRMAVQGEYRGVERDRDVDFVDILAFGDKAQVMHRNLRKGMRLIVVGALKVYERVDAYGQRKEIYCVICKRYEMVDSHQSREPIEDLSDSSGNLLIPKEITDSLIRQVDAHDEDMPADYIERSSDDLLKSSL